MPVIDFNQWRGEAPHAEIDYPTLARLALPHAREILEKWMPGGKVVGREYLCATIKGGAGTSCSTNIVTGVGSDFADGDRAWGDLISLVAQVDGVKPHEAAARIARFIGADLTKPLPALPPLSTPSPDEKYQAGREGARRMLDEAVPCPVDFSYLVKKGVKPAEGVKFHEATGNMLVSLFDEHGALWSVQRIFPDGMKKINDGGKLSGNMFVFQGNPERVYLGEGYATTATVNELTGSTSVMAITSGNMPAVAEALARMYPAALLIVAGDNDDAGRKAAAKVQEKVPRFKAVFPPKEGDDWNDLYTREGAEAVRAAIDAATGTGSEADTGVKSKRPLFDDVGRTLRAGGIPAPIWLVKQLIERGVIQLFGPPGSMKSFIAMLLAYCLATGRPFFGRKVDAGPVFYACGEGRAGAWRRMASLEVHYGVKIPEGSLFLSRRAVTLDAASVDGLCDEIRAAISTGGRPPVLIVIDTLARSLVGDENLQKDMSEFINAVEKVSAEFGCAALVVHHSGHSEDAKNRGRGSSVLLGACDSIIKCADRMLTWQKTKDADPPEPILFGFKVIPLGKDEDGEEINSGVIIEPGEGTAPRTSNIRLKSSAERLAMETLIRLSAKGELRAGRYWVGLDEWRTEFVRFHCGDNKKSKQTTFGRIRGKLADLELVSAENDWYAVVRPEDIAQVQDLVTFGPLLEKVATLATSENDPATL